MAAGCDGGKTAHSLFAGYDRRACRSSSRESALALRVRRLDLQWPLHVDLRRRSNVSNAQIASFDDGVSRG